MKFRLIVLLFCSIALAQRKIEEICPGRTEFLGKGAYGNVYGCIDTKGEEVAVKEIYPYKNRGGDATQVSQEIEVLKKIKQKGIPYMANMTFSADGCLRSKSEPCFIGFKKYKRGALIQYIDKIPEGFKIERVMVQIMLAVINMQISGFSHLDIKPDNVLLDDDLAPVITDFGSTMHESHKRFGKGLHGTLFYAAPEVNIDMKFSFKSDIWSLGIMFYELFGGKQTDLLEPDGFGFINKPEIVEFISAVKDEDIKKLPNYPENPIIDFEDLIKNKMLVFEPENRMSSQQMLELLAINYQNIKEKGSFFVLDNKTELEKGRKISSKSLNRVKAALNRMKAENPFKKIDSYQRIINLRKKMAQSKQKTFSASNPFSGKKATFTPPASLLKKIKRKR